MQAVREYIIPTLKLDVATRLEAPTAFHPLIFGIFLYLSFAVNYPGHLNPDSLQQLVWASHPSRMTDWHSPVVTWLWSISGPLLGQPAGALMTQCLCFAFFVAVLPRFPRHDARTVALLLGEAAFRTTLVSIAGIVIKDVLLTGLIMAILAALQLGMSTHARRWLGLTAALMVPVLLVRPTNFLMILIVCGLVGPLLVKTVRDYVLALVLAGALLVCVVPANNFVNRGILGAHNARAEKQLIIFDIAGMSNYTGKNLFATHPLWPVDRLPPPIPCYTPKRWNPYYFLGACRGYEAAFDEVSERSGSSLIDWWFGQVIRHPVAYLRHRFAYSHKLIRTQQHIIFPKPPYSDTLNSKLDPRYGNPAYNAEIREEGRPGAAHISLWPNTLAEEPFAKLSSLIFSRQNAYILSVLVCFGLWAWGLRRHFMGREVDPIAMLAAAMGLGNFGMLIFFGVASEGRYLLPTICCACFAALSAARALTREPRTQAPAA